MPGHDPGPPLPLLVSHTDTYKAPMMNKLSTKRWHVSPLAIEIAAALAVLAVIAAVATLSLFAARESIQKAYDEQEQNELRLHEINGKTISHVTRGKPFKVHMTDGTVLEITALKYTTKARIVFAD